MLNYRSIGRRISFYRKKKNLTQSVLSEKLGVSDSYVSQLEQGTAKVSLSRLMEISKYLDIDISLLVSDKMIVSQQIVNSEIFEIIKDWPEEHLSFLAELLACASDRLKNMKK